MDAKLELVIGTMAFNGQKPRNRGEELRYLIKMARTHLKSWETELQDYTKSTMAIRKLPVEVLSFIFKHAIRWDPRQVRRIMLVSRQWYRISISDPKLWTDIAVKLHQYENDLATYAEGITPYLVACIQRSQSMLLHIELDLRSLQSFQSAEHRRLSTMLNSYEFLEADAPLSTPGPTADSSPDDHSHIQDIFSLLVGENRRNLYRWGSLDLRLPGKLSVDSQIWASLKGSAPNMRTLSIEGHFHPEIGEFRIGGSIVSNVLRDFQHLTSLRVRRVEDFKKLQAPPLTLLKLDVESLLDEAGIAALERFVNLHTLRLVYPHTSRFLRNHASAAAIAARASRLKFHLAHLQRLYFLGRFESLAPISFQLPSLQHLYVVNPRDAMVDTLPTIRVPHVHFTVPYAPDDRKRSERAQESISKVIKHFQDAESLTIHSPRFDLTDQEANLAGLRERGLIPASIKTSVSRDIIGLEWFLH